MFPIGAAGGALFVLRVSVAVTLVVTELKPNPYPMPLWVVLCSLVLATFLVLGFLTPYCAVLGCVVEIIAFFIADVRNGLHFAASIMDGGVLAVMGPGAYSIDARMFGRRILTVPSRR
jgi:uncharacterized membrane protein YphA (DoxX/SURF4 family)